jgi:hypothetical protein
MKILVLIILLSTQLFAQRHGHGRNRQYRDVFHYLLNHHQMIKRNVTLIEKGVSTYTYSDNKKVSEHIIKHVNQMKGLIESGRRIRNWDPLFSAIFDNYELIEMKVIPTPVGIKVEETSHDPYVAKLIQEHAKVVSLFVQLGFEEAHRSHPVPVR